MPRGTVRLLRLKDVRATAEGLQPPGYRLVARGRLNLTLLSLLSLAAFPPALVLFAALTAPLGGPIDLAAFLEGQVSIAAGPADLLGLPLVLLALVVVLPVFHELAHGLAVALVGGRPVYGIGPGIAFCHFREFVRRGQYAAILLAPLVLISLAGTLAMPALPSLLRGPMLALLVANAAGAVGDLALLAQLARLPRAALIADTSQGFEVYAPEATNRKGEEPRHAA